MNTALNRIISNVTYDNGFHIDQKVYPYYSFCKPNKNAHWSNEMAESLEEATKHHFIDVYNRRIALDGIKSKLNEYEVAYLDIGCSSGYMLEDVMNRFPNSNIIGADFLPAGLIHCHNKIPSIPLFQIDIVNCNFGDNLFDAITCLNVLEHIEDDKKALNQIYRILKTNGRAAITVPMAPSLYDMYDEVHYHVRRYGFMEFREKLLNAGFKILKTNFFASFLYPAFFVVKKLNRIRYRNLSYKEKKKRVLSQIKKTERSKIMDKICNIEKFLGKVIQFPFGIRGYAITTKEGS